MIEAGGGEKQECGNQRSAQHGFSPFDRASLDRVAGQHAPQRRRLHKHVESRSLGIDTPYALARGPNQVVSAS